MSKQENRERFLKNVLGENWKEEVEKEVSMLNKRFSESLNKIFEDLDTYALKENGDYSQPLAKHIIEKHHERVYYQYDELEE